MAARTMLAALACAAALTGCGSVQAQAPYGNGVSASFRDRAPADEVVYFVLPDRFANGDTANDRGGYPDERLVSGYDPTAKGFYHGGDLKGLTGKLDYLQDMGVTAIWFAPIFQNKPVQGPKGDESAGYHGYWVTDFTRPDPHFGSREEFAAFVGAAHARGMKVYMDIITNHTADVIKYAEGDANGYRYRSRGDFPYSRKGGVDGMPINSDFAGDEDSSETNFAKLVDPSYAYTPVVPASEVHAKKPEWLNDPVYYHNRGNSTFTGEDSRFGDFSGLDDLFTENPRVRAGMTNIYAAWIDEFDIDGFRIDTARHVDPGFWQAFVPAMLEKAKAKGNPNFAIFGEVYKDVPDNGYIAQYTRRDKLPAVLDFAFQASMREVLGRGKGTAVLAQLYDGDVLYEGGEAAARNLPTFLGNHDMGRFATMIREDRPGISQNELLERVELGHAMLLTLRGAPVIYYGDEQGFAGDGGDQLAREDMFPSRVPEYNDNDLVGTDATTAQANFDEGHPLYRLISQLAHLRAGHPALRTGRQQVRHYEQEAGLFAVSRFDPATGREYVLAFNTAATARTANVVVGYDARAFETLAGACPATVAAPGSAAFALPAFGWAVCRVSETAR
ncbi:MAG: alpha-amylase family glycosyl hydrolase [Tsuneonella suprasediminis]|uniref:Alpha-amylase n=1 Tax=Tsuneonella suprasediminis TaxID=2306996 RepID=A0A419R358_9SPHN|nr:alpha-amylase family glycosyl hydrolase [Tsuneonella suprasediminis]RJX68729.1 alpha-amylase [Tsuneonella suprasediminis]